VDAPPPWPAVGPAPRPARSWARAATLISGRPWIGIRFGAAWARAAIGFFPALPDWARSKRTKVVLPQRPASA